VTPSSEGMHSRPWGALATYPHKFSPNPKKIISRPGGAHLPTASPGYACARNGL